MRLIRVVLVGIGILVAVLCGCSDVSYEHLDFSTGHFQSHQDLLVNAALRGSFGDPNEGVVQKGSPYSLVISFPAVAESREVAPWFLSELELTAASGLITRLGPNEKVVGRRIKKADGRPMIYFIMDNLAVPHERLVLRFVIEGPGIFPEPVSMNMEPRVHREESVSWLDRILSV